MVALSGVDVDVDVRLVEASPSPSPSSSSSSREWTYVVWRSRSQLLGGLAVPIWVSLSSSAPHASGDARDGVSADMLKKDAAPPTPCRSVGAGETGGARGCDWTGGCFGARCSVRPRGRVVGCNKEGIGACWVASSPAPPLPSKMLMPANRPTSSWSRCSRFFGGRCGEDAGGPRGKIE